MMLSRALFLMTACGIVAFIVLAIQLYNIQIRDHDMYESAAIEQQVRETTITADRGTIYDRSGKILAMSASVETVYISPREIQMYEEDPVLIAHGLSEILGVDYEKILAMTTDTKSWYKTIARKLEPELADQVRAFKNENKLIGVKIEPDTKRYYPYSSLCSHVIGFVGAENTGWAGIEYSMNETLSGTPGSIVRAKNSAGTDMLFTKYEYYQDAEDGNNVKLTIDTTIQYYLEKHLEQAVKDYAVMNGAAGIVMDPNTGEILAMASLGDFDLNNYQQVSEEAQARIDAAETEEEAAAILSAEQTAQWRNKAMSDTYEPGSTFKIITLAMALEEGLVKLEDGFYCNGQITISGRDEPVNCWKTAGHGSQSLVQAVQHSCNVAFVNIGLQVGRESFYDYCEAFGFFEDSTDSSAQLTGKTGIDLPGESGSIWWSHDIFTYNYSQLAAASFGQTFNITPLQLITSISACVNGGYLMQPYIVSEITTVDGDLISRTEPTVIRQVISEENSETLRYIIEQVVGDRVEGTGKNAYVAGYRIGGKTGTSTNTVIEAQTGKKEYIVSFVGVAPADDPQVVVLVLLDCPSEETGLYISGGQMAAPTVGNIMADVLPYLGVEANYTDEELRLMDKTVPNMLKCSLVEAQAMLANAGLTGRVIGDGDTVTMQLPHAGAVIAAQSEVILYADAEPSEELEEMPDLSGLTYEIARQRMGFYGLYVQRSDKMYYEAPTIQVTNQSIAPGTMVEHGTVVEVTLTDYDNSIYGRY
ncbi:MAG: penicillin-binding transpeptidase domain-containing protein [Eubacteriales bacterium]|nr:penicillin-binding transpeptidase domain-containing protein [Eubacteriales bacterium]